MTVDKKVNSGKQLDLSEIVVPYNMAHFQLDDYRINKGWPVAVPPYDIRATGFVSSTGDIITARPHPASVKTAADLRWIPTTETWDDISLRWSPEDSPNPGYTWATSVEYAPTYLDDYSYRVGKEIITRSALNFVSEQHEHIWSDFNGGFGSLGGFTVIMVLSLQSRFGTDGPDVDYAGLFCAGHATPASDEDLTFDEVVTGATSDLHLRGRHLWVDGTEGGFQQLFPINLALTRAQPSYLAITVNPPYTKVYMGFGVSTMQVSSARTGDAASNHLDWVIARSTGSLKHCADMSLFDLSLYANPLDEEELLSEVATLSQAYGG
jgi:hypothetical protein